MVFPVGAPLLAAVTLALERLEANLLSGLANEREALARGACLPLILLTDPRFAFCEFFTKKKIPIEKLKPFLQLTSNYTFHSTSICRILKLPQKEVVQNLRTKKPQSELSDFSDLVIGPCLHAPSCKSINLRHRKSHLILRSSQRLRFSDK